MSSNCERNVSGWNHATWVQSRAIDFGIQNRIGTRKGQIPALVTVATKHFEPLQGLGLPWGCDGWLRFQRKRAGLDERHRQSSVPRLKESQNTTSESGVRKNGP
jgi:hypothetical protein